MQATQSVCAKPLTMTGTSRHLCPYADADGEVFESKPVGANQA